MERKPDAHFARFGSTEILISVHPAHRRQGVATRALEQLLKKMDDAFVLVSPENPAALSLFSRMKGFSQVHDLQQARVYWQDRMDSMDISCPSGPATVPLLKHSSGTIVLS